MKRSKILFLDIDGVLNSVQHKALKYGTYGLAPEHIAHLNHIVEEVEDVCIVLSSTWRLHHSAEEMTEMLKAEGFIGTIHDCTPDLTVQEGSIWLGNCRGYEIQTWLDDNSPKALFAILDDDSDMGPIKNHLFKTRFRTGLTKEIAQQVVQYLNYPNRKEKA